jgi:hypothetical protein
MCDSVTNGRQERSIANGRESRMKVKIHRYKHAGYSLRRSRAYLKRTSTAG